MRLGGASYNTTCTLIISLIPLVVVTTITKNNIYTLMNMYSVDNGGSAPLISKFQELQEEIDGHLYIQHRYNPHLTFSIPSYSTTPTIPRLRIDRPTLRH